MHIALFAAVPLIFNANTAADEQSKRECQATADGVVSIAQIYRQGVENRSGSLGLQIASRSSGKLHELAVEASKAQAIFEAAQLRYAKALEQLADEMRACSN